MTDNVALPDGGIAGVAINLSRHLVILKSSTGIREEFGMTDGSTATELGDRLVAAAAQLGLEGEVNRAKYENDDPRPYDTTAATALFGAFAGVSQAFEEHRAGLQGPTGPVQIWPHGFDMAFEWFGTRIERYEEQGEMQEMPAQLNLGFYPGGRPYLYSNPWPFDDALAGKALPHGAVWNTEGWQGSMIHYDQLAGDPDARTKLLEYAAAVHDLAAPTLMA